MCVLRYLSLILSWGLLIASFWPSRKTSPVPPMNQSSLEMVVHCVCSLFFNLFFVFDVVLCFCRWCRAICSCPLSLALVSFLLFVLCPWAVLVLEIKSNPKNKNKETRAITFMMNKITANLSKHPTTYRTENEKWTISTLNVFHIIVPVLWCLFCFWKFPWYCCCLVAGTRSCVLAFCVYCWFRCFHVFMFFGLALFCLCSLSLIWLLFKNTNEKQRTRRKNDEQE